MHDATRPIDTSVAAPSASAGAMNGRPPAGKYVAITGAIAAGATTLSTVLRERLHWTRYEDEHVHASNAFFRDAYADFPRWGFHSQVNFMLASAERHAGLRVTLERDPPNDVPIMEDRTPFEHTGAYLRAYRKAGLLSQREADLLERLGQALSSVYVTPDLLVFRRISEEQMVRRVRERNRPGEADASIEFLSAVRDSFEEMMAQWTRSPLIVLSSDVDVLDPAQAEEVTRMISLALTGSDLERRGGSDE